MTNTNGSCDLSAREYILGLFEEAGMDVAVASKFDDFYFKFAKLLDHNISKSAGNISNAISFSEMVRLGNKIEVKELEGKIDSLNSICAKSLVEFGSNYLR